MAFVTDPAPGFWDGPSPGPHRRRPMEELLHELAERTGRPVWPVRIYQSNYQAERRARAKAHRHHISTTTVQEDSK